jgi:hypothetical protein
LETGLPDGIFSYQKSQFGLIFENLGMENVGIFIYIYSYFKAIWYDLWPFVIVCGHLVLHFSRNSTTAWGRLPDYFLIGKVTIKINP